LVAELLIHSLFRQDPLSGSISRGSSFVSNISSPTRKRVRFAPVAIGTGVLAAVLLSVTMSGTLAGFTASINNTTNTAASGSLVMQEQNAGATVTCLSTDGGSVSTNTSTCAGINKFGGATTMVPGQTVTTSVTIKNIGSAAAGTFTLTPTAACAQATSGAQNGNAIDLCAKMNLVLTNTTTSQVVYTGALSGLGTSPITITTPPVAGATNTFSFAVTLAAAAGNSYQGLQASVPLTWTFAS
jgi:hypothetical protein